MTVSRRTFIVGCSAAIAAMTGGAVRGLAFAQPGDTTRRDILVVVFLRGGCDGLSLVAPVNDPFYKGARGELRVEESGQNAGLLLSNIIPGADFCTRALRRFNRCTSTVRWQLSTPAG
jgi:uncharacterized protein (DUF1501 family)